MKQISKNGIIKCHLNNSKSLAGLTFFLFFFAIISNVNAQEEMKQERFGVHAGRNAGILDATSGPFFSLHFTPRSEKMLLFETMLFYGRQSGTTFMSSNKKEASALGLTAGLRINVLPRKNWNPSFVIMTGIAYYSKKIERYSRERHSINGHEYWGDGAAYWASDGGAAVAAYFGFSNTLYKKHMVSVGLIIATDMYEGFDAVYIKYGIWF